MAISLSRAGTSDGPSAAPTKGSVAWHSSGTWASAGRDRTGIATGEQVAHQQRCRRPIDQFDEWHGRPSRPRPCHRRDRRRYIVNRRDVASAERAWLGGGGSPASRSSTVDHPDPSGAGPDLTIV